MVRMLFPFSYVHVPEKFYFLSVSVGHKTDALHRHA